MSQDIFSDRPEIWGGIECTINRIGDTFKDQLQYSGHYWRHGDIDAIAQLGIKTIRYPVLWEKHQAKRNSPIDWSWTDRQLGNICASGMKPIAGFLHHGSGPSFTNLLDPEFPYLLASFAYEVASRYPWLEDYTPVNEPLTTARFSGLYGHWYPHVRDEHLFYSMLLNQLKAVVLSMEAIRSVNPNARLIQTEDLGKTYSTPSLAYQARFENERRLLSFDILTGSLSPDHPHYDYMVGCGVSKDDIEFFQQHPCPPDLLGLNYYVTSERWLDEKVENYPHHTHGGNSNHRYSDTEMVRSEASSSGGLIILATEIWTRYGIPMAVTEAHLHCTRDEQIRWFKDVWDDTCCLRKRGVDIRAVTAWALLGSFDWDTLLTKTGSQYESGVFDVKTKSGQLRPTAIASLLRTLANGENEFHPVLTAPGWWRADKRGMNIHQRPILVIKAFGNRSGSGIHSGRLLSTLIDACKQRRISIVFTNDPGKKYIEQLNPWGIIHLGNTDSDFLSICVGNQMKGVVFDSIDEDSPILKFSVRHQLVTIHHINRILDLMIDDETGCWEFSGDGQITKVSASTESKTAFVQISPYSA